MIDIFMVVWLVLLTGGLVFSFYTDKTIPIEPPKKHRNRRSSRPR